MLIIFIIKSINLKRTHRSAPLCHNGFCLTLLLRKY